MSFLRVIIPILLLISSFAGAALVLWPNYQEYSALKAQIQEREERLAKGEAVLNRLKSIRLQVEEHQNDFEKVKRAIPRETELPALYDVIQDLGSSSGIVVQSIEAKTPVSEDKPKDGVQEIILQVEGFGTYEGFKNFLGAARSFARILNVQSITISEAAVSEISEEEASGLLGIQAELKAYSYEHN